MEFLLQPFNSRTLIEEVNDSDVPTAPLRYAVLSMAAAELPVASASSADALVCSPPDVATAEGADRPQASEHSIEQVDLQAPGWTRRVRIGAAASRTWFCTCSKMELHMRINDLHCAGKFMEQNMYRTKC